MAISGRLRPLRVGLSRHRGTESRASGASPGTELLFTTLDPALRRRCEVWPLPPYYYGAPASVSVGIAEELLAEVDALVWAVPPHPADVEALALVRQRLKRRVPLVYLPLGEFPRGAVAYRRLQQYLEPGDVLAFSSTADLAVHDRLVRTTPATTCVLPFGIDPAPFLAAAGTRDRTRSRLGLGEDLVLIVHGRTDESKNVHGAAAVLREVVRQVPKARLWILGDVPERGPGIPSPVPLSLLGDGPFVARLRRSLGDLDPASVTCWGDVPRHLLPELLAAADVSVNLTLNLDENFGFGAVEAMAAGLPVVGSDWGGLRDTVDDGVTGFRVDTVLTPRGAAVDVPRAADHVVALAGDRRARAAMGAAARARVERLYTLDHFAQALERLVRSALADVPERPTHDWSDLGARLDSTYSVPLAGARRGTFPLPFPVHGTAADWALQCEVARPYALRVQESEPVAGALYAASRPGECAAVPGPPVRAAGAPYVLARLESGPATTAELERLDGGGALSELVRAGEVVRTARPTDWSPQVIEGAPHVGLGHRG
ncbi:glycosyltransferase family 4 protein [Nocardioides aequoreus]|uniref:glycosyltransferase family 4 protein n=1 Tax=Nocardioides aequoreus TaxID=397278 RepID=UPI00068B69A0|nr:glycosyltransferase family 4 protein [Nocardioides aequoreus]